MFVSRQRLQDDHKKNTAQNWTDLLAVLFQMSYALQPEFKINPSDPISASSHFLTSKIETIDWYDESGEKHTLTSYHEQLPSKNPQRIVAKIKHIELEYLPAQKNEDEKFKASGQQYDVTSQDFEEANNAMMEKALAAQSIAYMAQANGWDSIDFDKTNDPIDRAMLMLACDRLGIDYGDETIHKSAVNGVTVRGEEHYLQSGYIMAMEAEMTKQNHDISSLDLIATAAQAAFKTYIEQQPPIFPKDFSTNPQYFAEPSNDRPQQPNPIPPPLATTGANASDVLNM